jgi:CNT family concentrative nucleoside transporter
MKFISLLGIVALIGVAWLLSEHKRRFPFRAVLWGLTLQFFFGWFILKTGPGEALFNACQQLVSRFIGFANEGNKLMFGPLANEAVMSKAFGPENALFFALVITGIIVLISTVSSVLYHYGFLQLVVRAAAWVMRRAMGTSGSETLSAAANIFMGQTEAPLVIRPYLPGMTRSELHCMMVGGFATIAGSVMECIRGCSKCRPGIC